MRIRAFSTIVDECAKQHRLKDCKLVIDGQNFFYDCYKESKLTFKYGAECDRYAAVLKRLLNKFKQANIECYFIFKGGTKGIMKKVDKDRTSEKKFDEFCNPVFATAVHLQVLKEMGFNYVFSEFEAKTDCINLAKELSCAVLSMDADFAISEVSYVPKITLSYDENLSFINCKMFSLDYLLKKFNVDDEKLATFIVLTDTHLFQDGSFLHYFRNRKLLIKNYHLRNQCLLALLSKTSLAAELPVILKGSTVSKTQFLQELARVKSIINGSAVNSDDFIVKYIMCKNFSEPDKWFQYGVASGFIAKPYVDIYRSNLLLVSEGNRNDGKNAIELSLSIIKYAYDLLTNFKNNGLMYFCNYWDSGSEPKTLKDSVKKPYYQANECVFESGWDKIGSLGLFHHFMTAEINFKFDKLEQVPNDAKLLMIALVYFHRKKSCSTTKTAVSAIMCYAMLNAVETSANLMEQYFDTYSCDTELLDSLFEFQCCLREINYLNNLCGKPFVSTVYGNTYNGTVVYNLAYILQNNDEREYVSRVLATAPEILNFVNSLIEHYHNLIA